jgi:polyhydroxyalkanoate synthesis repressor PhaR
MLTVKKYPNRRLYDTNESRYITMEELAETIRKGTDVRVLDAKTNEDLTAQTLTQIVVEGRGAARMLPVPLLTQLIRMGDDALAEFFGRYVTWTLDMYLRAKNGAQAIAPFNPFVMAPFTAGNAIARMFGGGKQDYDPPPPSPIPTPPPAASDVADLRRELDELKKALGKKKRRS